MHVSSGVPGVLMSPREGLPCWRKGETEETRRQEEAEERTGQREFPVNHPILVSLGAGGVCLFACCVRGCVCKRTHALESHQRGSGHVTPAGRSTAVCLPTSSANRV